MGQSQLVAGGNISPSRFVTQSTTDWKVTQSGAGSKVLGVSQVGTNFAPIPEVSSPYAAIAGQQLSVFEDGEECLLELGGSVTAGDELKSDASGKGVVLAGSGAENIGALALQSGSSGELIKVRVHRDARYT